MAENVAVDEPTSPASAIASKRRLLNSNVYTIDITRKFRDASFNLPAGTLIKDEQFTLFESVGALEIGDPKMDSGCAEDGDSFEDEFDVAQVLSPTQILWLMDELLSREVAWHMGYPLSQTLFTSVYIEKLLWPDPTQLQDAQFSKDQVVQEADQMLHKLFRSYCLGLIKSCDLVLSMVTSQHFYEEEDFATQLYNRELLRRFAVDDILADMKQAAEYLDSADLDDITKESIAARMGFRSDFLLMLASHATAYDPFEPNAVVDGALLSKIRTSTYLGIPVSDSFTLKIQRRLASTVPPRPMVTIDEDRAFAYLEQFILDCENAFSVLCATHSYDLLNSYSIFCSQTPPPSVYVRALLQSWLNRDDLIAGVANEFDFISTDMRSTTFAASPVLQAIQPGSANRGDNFQLAKQFLHEFMSKTSRSFLNIWRTACLNRCRVRRTLCHAALEWDQIQAEAEQLDDDLQNLVDEPAHVYPVGGAPTFSYSVSSWIYHHKLHQLRLIVQTGFELDVYAPHELASMYWYLYHLTDTHLAHLERISFFISQRQSSVLTFQPHSLRAAGQEECRASLDFLYRQFSWLKATEAAARSLHGIYLVLQRQGQLQQPTTTYASDGLRYELRMRPFLHLSIPEPLQFEQFRRLSLMEVRTELEILEEATACIGAAKKGWEEALKAPWNAFPLREEARDKSDRFIGEKWRDDVRGALKATISMSITITKLRKHLEAQALNPSLKLKAFVPCSGDKDYFHAYWLVPRLVFESS